MILELSKHCIGIMRLLFYYRIIDVFDQDLSLMMKDIFVSNIVL